MFSACRSLRTSDDDQPSPGGSSTGGGRTRPDLVAAARESPGTFLKAMDNQSTDTLQHRRDRTQTLDAAAPCGGCAQSLTGACGWRGTTSAVPAVIHLIGPPANDVPHGAGDNFAPWPACDTRICLWPPRTTLPTICRQ